MAEEGNQVNKILIPYYYWIKNNLNLICTKMTKPLNRNPFSFKNILIDTVSQK